MSRTLLDFSFSHRCQGEFFVLIILAGHPTTTTFGGTSFVTTLLAPTMLFFPIFTPSLIKTPAPIQQLSPIATSPLTIFNFFLLKSWFAIGLLVYIFTKWLIIQFFPIWTLQPLSDWI